MLVAANKPFFQWLKRLSKLDSFVATTSLSDRQLEEQFDMELVLRFIIFRTLEEKRLRQIGDLGDFVTDEMVALSDRFSQFKDIEEQAFTLTFDSLDKSLGYDAFRKYDTAKKRFLGSFSISAFEVVACGVGYNVPNLVRSRTRLSSRKFYGSGKTRISSRLPGQVFERRLVFRRPFH